MLMACDGVLISTPESWDELSIIGARYWMKETSRNAYAIGPMIARGPRATENELAIASRGAETREFLARVFRERGEQSLLYVRSFCNHKAQVPYLHRTDLIRMCHVAQIPRQAVDLLGRRDGAPNSLCTPSRLSYSSCWLIRSFRSLVTHPNRPRSRGM